ncbi:MAG: GNAT family N-acyltransferase, partial [Pseudomonadota bacterium]
MVGFRRGRYLARFAETPQDVERTKRLRNLCFRGTEDGLDQDQFDDTCEHVMVEESASGMLVCCFR